MTALPDDMVEELDEANKAKHEDIITRRTGPGVLYTGSTAPMHPEPGAIWIDTSGMSEAKTLEGKTIAMTTGTEVTVRGATVTVLSED